jgi:ABC-type proline/glycine betaine transport system substrate-binding protein
MEAAALRVKSRASGARVARPRRAGVTLALPALAALSLLAAPWRGRAADAPITGPASFQLVRLSDIGWTDVTATTSVFSAVLQHLRR